MADETVMRNDDFVEIPSTGEVLKEEGEGIALDMGAAESAEIIEEFAQAGKH